MLHRFLGDQRANVAVIFGMLVIPVMGVVGMAMDYARGTLTRTDIQNAIDASALMIASDLKKAPTLTAAEVQSRTAQYFTATFRGRFATANTVTASYTPATAANGGTSTVSVAAKADVPTLLGRVVGPDVMQVGTDTQVVWGIKRLEVALALDNTGSMAQSNKMTELKKASKTLMDMLHKTAKKAGDVKIAIVPFATDVNVGTGNAAASWLDWQDWGQNNPGVNAAAWNGCVWDRNQPYDIDDTAPTSKQTRFEPHQAANCPTSMLGLTDIFTNNAWSSSDLTSGTPTSVLGQKIQAMNPTGNTNVGIGMAWGWHALTKTLPLDQASDTAADLDKVIILLTDGTNTQNRWNTSSSQIDGRTEKTCENAKSAGIKIYTVRVIDGNANLLRKCATNPGMFFDIKNASELEGVFQIIANSLANLRIAQ